MRTRTWPPRAPHPCSCFPHACLVLLFPPTRGLRFFRYAPRFQHVILNDTESDAYMATRDPEVAATYLQVRNDFGLICPCPPPLWGYTSQDTYPAVTAFSVSPHTCLVLMFPQYCCLCRTADGDTAVYTAGQDLSHPSNTAVAHSTTRRPTHRV